MQSRLAELERLVLTLMPDSATRSATTPVAYVPASSQATNPVNNTDTPHLSTPRDDCSEAGSMREHRYVGGEHWMAIVDSIAELREHIDREEQLAMADAADRMSGETEDDISGDSTPGSHVLLLYGCEPATSRDEILAALPPKAAVDRYVARYFNFQELISCKYCEKRNAASEETGATIATLSPVLEYGS